MSVKNSNDVKNTKRSAPEQREDDRSPEQRLAETDRGREAGDGGLRAAIKNSGGGRDDS